MRDTWRAANERTYRLAGHVTAGRNLLTALGIVLAIPLASRAAIKIDPNDVGATAVYPAYDNSDPWQPTGHYFVIGNSGNVEILVDGGSDVIFPYTWIFTGVIGGGVQGGFARVIVDGPESSWSDSSPNNNSFSMGGNGITEFTVLNGAMVNVGGGGAFASKSNEHAGHSVLTVSGAGSLWNGRDGDIGVSAVPGAYATLHVLEGGEVRGRSLFVGIWPGNNGAALAEVKGAGSKVMLGVPGAGSVVQVLSGGEHGLHILEGGLVETQHGWVGQYGDGTASVVVDGDGSKWNMSSELAVGYDGAANVTISHGGAVNSVRGYLGVRTSLSGFAQPSPGLLTVAGIGSSWTMTQGLVIGYNDHGEMVVRDGATATCTSVNVATAAGTSGELTVEGAGSRFAMNGPLQVGARGNGKVNVRSGGVIAATQTTINGGGTLSGDGALIGLLFNSGVVQPGDSPGTLTVDGVYLQNAIGQLEIELGNASHDRLDVTDTAILDGVLRVSIFDEGPASLMPKSGDAFEFLRADNGRTGEFGFLDLPPLPGSLNWRVLYSADAVSLLVVPEPGPWILAMGAIVSLVPRRNLRRSERA